MEVEKIWMKEGQLKRRWFTSLFNYGITAIPEVSRLDQFDEGVAEISYD